MARVLKMAHRNIFLACGNLCCPIFFFFLFLLPEQRLYILKNMCRHTRISDYVESVYELSLVLNNTAMKHFYSNRDRREVLTGYLSVGYRRGGDWVNT